MKIRIFFSTLLAAILLVSCNNQKQPPVNLARHAEAPSNVIEVEYTDFGGVKTIPAKLNGVSMDMIFDTGCSGISLSLHEFMTMYKNGQISANDLTGDITEATIADGSTIRSFQIELQTVEIGGSNGIVARNVLADVVPNQTAPVLLGNNVLNGVRSIEVDNSKHVIRFKKR